MKSPNTNHEDTSGAAARRQAAPPTGYSHSQPRAGGGGNEDCCLCDDSRGLYIIADGMGGHEFGREASAKVVQTIQSIVDNEDPLSAVPDAGQLGENDLKKSFLSHAVGQANIELCKIASDRKAPLGSTCTAVWLGEKQLWGAHVGDCRLYLFGEELEGKVLTREHRPRGGAVKNRLERSLGESLNVACDTFAQELSPCFSLLLCCDGVWEHITLLRLAEVVRTTPARDVAGRLTALAVQGGSDDDVTVVYVESTEMTRHKERLIIAALEAELVGGSGSREARERVLSYHAHRGDAPAVLKHLWRYVEAGTPSSDVLRAVLPVVQKHDKAEYTTLLQLLWQNGQLPGERLPDLLHSLYENGDLGDMAVRAYKQRLREQPNDLWAGGFLGASFLRRGDKAKAEKYLSAVFKDGDEQLQDCLLDLLGGQQFGLEGREMRLLLSIRASFPGVAKPLCDELKAKRQKGDTTAEGRIIALLRDIAERYPVGSTDRTVAKQVIDDYDEAQKSARLERDIQLVQGQLGLATEGKNTLEQEKAALARQVAEAQQQAQEFRRKHDELREENTKLLEDMKTQKDGQDALEAECADLNRKHRQAHEAYEQCYARIQAMERKASASLRSTSSGTRKRDARSAWPVIKLTFVMAFVLGIIAGWCLHPVLAPLGGDTSKKASASQPGTASLEKDPDSSSRTVSPKQATDLWARLVELRKWAETRKAFAVIQKMKAELKAVQDKNKKQQLDTEINKLAENAHKIVRDINELNNQTRAKVNAALGENIQELEQRGQRWEEERNETLERIKNSAGGGS